MNLSQQNSGKTQNDRNAAQNQNHSEQNKKPLPPFFDRRNASNKLKRRDSEDLKDRMVQGLDASKSRTGIHKVHTDSISGGMRYSSIDRPIIDLPKRQSAVVKESRPIIGGGDGRSRCATLIDEEALSDGNGQITSDGKSNGGKGSSRGSVKRRAFGNSGGGVYYTNAQARIASKIRGNGNSIAPKDPYDADTLLSDEKQIEQYFSNHKLLDAQTKQKELSQPNSFQTRDSASANHGAVKKFQSNRSTISKS